MQCYLQTIGSASGKMALDHGALFNTRLLILHLNVMRDDHVLEYLSPWSPCQWTDRLWSMSGGLIAGFWRPVRWPNKTRCGPRESWFDCAKYVERPSDSNCHCLSTQNRFRPATSWLLEPWPCWTPIAMATNHMPATCWHTFSSGCMHLCNHPQANLLWSSVQKGLGCCPFAPQISQHIAVCCSLNGVMLHLNYVICFYGQRLYVI